MDNSQEFKKFLDLLRKSGVKSFKDSQKGLEIQFTEEALLPKSPYKLKKNDKADPISEESYSEEDVLYWSSSQIPEAEAMQ